MCWPKAPIAKKTPAWTPLACAASPTNGSRIPGGAWRQLTEGGGRAVGPAGEIAPAGRQDPSAIESFAVLEDQLAETADVAEARADAKPARPDRPRTRAQCPSASMPAGPQIVSAK